MEFSTEEWAALSKDMEDVMIKHNAEMIIKSDLHFTKKDGDNSKTEDIEANSETESSS